MFKRTHHRCSSNPLNLLVKQATIKANIAPSIKISEVSISLKTSVYQRGDNFIKLFVFKLLSSVVSPAVTVILNKSIASSFSILELTLI